MHSANPINALINGRYKLNEKIGSGAFGEVYSGHDIVSNEEVAIKIVHLQKLIYRQMKGVEF